jgi:flavodoxin
VRTVSSRRCLLGYSRRGEPGENAVNESFFSRLRVESADVFYEARSSEELQELVDRAIAYYNDERSHSSLGYRTPLALVNDFFTSQQEPVQAVSWVGLITDAAERRTAASAARAVARGAQKDRIGRERVSAHGEGGMMRILVVFHSQEKGNTRRLADLVAEGCRQVKGVSVSLVNVNEACVSIDDAEGADGYAFGSPNYCSYMAGGLKQFFDDLLLATRAKRNVTNKPFVAFLTHGGGRSGVRAFFIPGAGAKAVRSIERLARTLELQRVGESVVCQGQPSGATVDKAIQLGRSLADHLATKS